MTSAHKQTDSATRECLISSRLIDVPRVMCAKPFMRWFWPQLFWDCYGLWEAQDSTTAHS